ncbi:NAD(P) transhydrogenase subunit beta [Micromonospora globispora]|uniref:NAD(P)(+) transhydrogenase (Re/Si-specific) subunit beta n=1 Tax=Micromonospora globispora TaxID=1450148 RepID=UPI000D703866|nr:NAD(P)(+) transhydrogenase (Re/Si-specific) subunit beta [Micromonospora globispora]PWU54875.1 NAD(P) transhydrogenase subunit beta [Micromonospora globispora]
MSTLDTVIRLVYLAAAACFVIGLHLMNSPRTARRGNTVSAAGMVAAALATLVLLVDSGAVSATGWLVLLCGATVGAGAGWYFARTVAMTAMPQLVSLFNAVGGGAAGLIAVHDFTRVAAGGGALPARVAVPTVLDIVIGAVTLAGSVVASGKLQGVVASRPLVFPGARAVNATLALVMIAAGGYLATGAANVTVLVVLAVAATAFGVTMVLPIGGADMPVVISLLNAFTGTAVAMAGFVIGNTVLIIAGALVGASGGILTKLMADAMNRSIANIIVGGFGTSDGPAADTGPGAQVRAVSADDAAIQLAYASKVVIVPGYGLAAAQAQHEVRELADLLQTRGVEVSYAIHPVAGRMPGHMNVLLAEANVPYSQLKEMDDANRELARADVALVIGANDVVNPAARRPGNPVSGMPILDVDHARSVIVIKRSMGHGYAGIDNELYSDPRTGMYFADAKKGLAELAAAVKMLVG